MRTAGETEKSTEHIWLILTEGVLVL